VPYLGVGACPVPAMGKCSWSYSGNVSRCCSDGNLCHVPQPAGYEPQLPCRDQAISVARGACEDDDFSAGSCRSRRDTGAVGGGGLVCQATDWRVPSPLAPGWYWQPGPWWGSGGSEPVTGGSLPSRMTSTSCSRGGEKDMKGASICGVSHLLPACHELLSCVRVPY
jgi:hypothetical protein